MIGRFFKFSNTRLNNALTITRATLTSGITEITITDAKITENSILSFYTSIYGVSPTAVSVSSGSVILTFDAQETDMEVGVQVNG